MADEPQNPKGLNELGKAQPASKNAEPAKADSGQPGGDGQGTDSGNRPVDVAGVGKPLDENRLIDAYKANQGLGAGPAARPRQYAQGQNTGNALEDALADLENAPGPGGGYGPPRRRLSDSDLRQRALDEAGGRPAEEEDTGDDTEETPEEGREAGEEEPGEEAENEPEAGGEEGGPSGEPEGPGGPAEAGAPEAVETAGKAGAGGGTTAGGTAAGGAAAGGTAAAEGAAAEAGVAAAEAGAAAAAPEILTVLAVVAGALAAIAVVAGFVLLVALPALQGGGSDAEAGVPEASGDFKSLAQQILKNPKISAQPNPKGSLEAAADGKCSPVPQTGACSKLDPRMLKALLEMANANITLTITSLTTGDHATCSNHYSGRAADLGVNPKKAEIRQIAQKNGATEFGGDIPNPTETASAKNHIHIGWPGTHPVCE